jgi:predicted acetyltransferase
MGNPARGQASFGENMSSERGRAVAHASSVTLEPIGLDRSFVLHNLLELYVHDFSEIVPFELKPNGRFAPTLSEIWWTGEDHFPFFILIDGKLSGFALVQRGSRSNGAPDAMDIAEFFVLRGARRTGVGTHVAHALFAAFPGRWEVRVRTAHGAGLSFWRHAVTSWVGTAVVPVPWTAADGVAWDVLRF